MKFKSKAVQVKISKSAQYSPVIRVWEHEVPILENQYGVDEEGNSAVAIVPSKAKPVEREFDAGLERVRLSNKYTKKAVEAVYGNRATSTLGKGMPQVKAAKAQKEVPEQQAAA